MVVLKNGKVSLVREGTDSYTVFISTQCITVHT